MTRVKEVLPYSPGQSLAPPRFPKRQIRLPGSNRGPTCKQTEHILGIDFGTTSCRATFIDPSGTPSLVANPGDFYRKPYLKSKHGPYEFATVGAILPDGALIVGDDAYKQRDDGASYFVHLKPSVYIVAGVDVDALAKYEPLRALLTHIVDDDFRIRLRELLVHFFSRMRNYIDLHAKKKSISYHAIGLTIPNCWADGPLGALQAAYESIIGEVWPEIRRQNGIDVLFEVEALAHYMFRSNPEQLRQFDKITFCDCGGHTASVQSFEPYWAGSSSDSTPTFMSVGKGWSHFAGGECWEHCLINRARPKLDAQGIRDPDIRRQILRSIRRYLNEGYSDGPPWSRDAILMPDQHASGVRVELEVDVIRTCFDIAFRPILDAIRATVKDGLSDNSLVLLYGGSTRHDFLREAIADVLRESMNGTTKLIGVHAEGGETIERGSASYRSKAYREAHQESDSNDGSERNGKRGRPLGLPTYHTVEFASSLITGDYKSAISEGAALAVSHKLTVKEFLQRGAVIGINLDPNSRVDVLLRDFCEGHRIIEGGLKGLVIPDTVTDSDIDTEEKLPPNPDIGTKEKPPPNPDMESDQEQTFKMIKNKDGKIIRRQKKWISVPRKKDKHRVTIVCGPMATGRRGMTTERTYRLFHLKGMKPGTYDLDMACDVSASKLTVTSKQLGTHDRKEWKFDLYFDIGSSCVMLENPVGVFIPEPVNEENEEARPPAQAGWDHQPVRELEADNQEANRAAEYPSPTISNHPAPDGIRCDTSESNKNAGEMSRVKVSFLCN